MILPINNIHILIIILVRAPKILTNYPINDIVLIVNFEKYLVVI